MSDPLTLTVTRDIAAPPEVVFDSWLDPARAGQFLFRTDGGELLHCEIDARPYGIALIVERRAGGDMEHRLQYLTIDRPSLLDMMFAAGPAGQAQWTRLNVTFAAVGGGTRVILTHHMDPAWAAYEDQTRHGWTMILASLARLLERNHG